MSQRATLLEGSLDDIDLANVVQTVSVSRRSVALELREPGGSVFGTLVLKAGQIVSVASEGLSGVDALRKLVAARRPGRFLVYRASGVDLREHMGPVAEVLSSVLSAPAPGGPDAPGVLAHGSLDTLELRAVIEALSLSRLHVTLELFAADGTRLGLLALKGGQVLSASAGSDAGLLAARALLEAPPAGRFVVRAARASVPEPLFSVAALLRQPAREESLFEVADEDIAEADADDAPVTQVALRPTPSQPPPLPSRPPPLPSQPPAKRAASLPPRPSAPPAALRGDATGPGRASVRPASLPPPSLAAAREAGVWPVASPEVNGAPGPVLPAPVASPPPESGDAREIAGAKTEPRASAPWLDAAPALDDEEPLLLQPRVPSAASRSAPPAKLEPTARRSAPAQPILPSARAALPALRVNGGAVKPHAPSLVQAVARQQASKVSAPAVASAAPPSDEAQAPPAVVGSTPPSVFQGDPAAPAPVSPPSAAPAAGEAGDRPSAAAQSVASPAVQVPEPSPEPAESAAPQPAPTAEPSPEPAESAAPQPAPTAEPSSEPARNMALNPAPSAEPGPVRPPSGAPAAPSPVLDRAPSAAPPAGRGRRSERPAAPPARAEGPREATSDATITARHPALRSGTPIVAITSPKGGAGRSTVALNLAVSLARRGRRVVLVDADASNLLPALDLADRAFKGVADALEGWAPLADTVLETRVPGLKLVPSGELTEETYRHPGWLALLADLARQADVVLVDCAPGWYGATLSVLEAATHQLLVLAAEPAARRICGAYQERLQKLLKGKHRPELLGLVINMLDYQVQASVRSLEELSTSAYARHLLEIPIPRSPTFMEASARCVPIVQVEQGASSTIAWVFETLATALLERLQLERAALASAPLLA
jgi:MinD-like ATPase involved in chromosome partitioning or flagellar assembly